MPILVFGSELNTLTPVTPRKLILATRKSPLALAQSEMVAAHLSAALKVKVVLKKYVTKGDRQIEWSLEEKGGKGLFTSELEEALIAGEADLAVHSSKDLPGDLPAGLMVAGYMYRADVRDVLVLRNGIKVPRKIATGSPRRRTQLKLLFPDLEFTEIRGNVDTRLKKIAELQIADGTVLAAAGLCRLRIAGWPGLKFQALELSQMVPAVGQGAIAIQTRLADAPLIGEVLDEHTARCVRMERAFQYALGSGCQTAFGANVAGDKLHIYHEDIGQSIIPLNDSDYDAPADTAERVLKKLELI